MTEEITDVKRTEEWTEESKWRKKNKRIDEWTNELRKYKWKQNWRIKNIRNDWIKNEDKIREWTNKRINDWEIIKEGNDCIQKDW